MKNRKDLRIIAMLVVAIALFAACDEKRTSPNDGESNPTPFNGLVGDPPPELQENLIRSYITPNYLTAKEVKCEANFMDIFVAVVEKQRLYNYGPTLTAFRRISRYKGDTDYNQMVFPYEVPGSLAPDVKRIRIFECETNGTVRRDLDEVASVIYESYDVHRYKGYKNTDPAKNPYGIESRYLRAERLLTTFEGIRLPYFPDYWAYMSHPLCTVHIFPPPTEPGLVRVEILLDETPYTLEVKIGQSFEEPWMERPQD